MLKELKHVADHVELLYPEGIDEEIEVESVKTPSPIVLENKPQVRNLILKPTTPNSPTDNYNNNSNAPPKLKILTDCQEDSVPVAPKSTTHRILSVIKCPTPSIINTPRSSKFNFDCIPFNNSSSSSLLSNNNNNNLPPSSTHSNNNNNKFTFNEEEVITATPIITPIDTNTQYSHGNSNNSSRRVSLIDTTRMSQPSNDIKRKSLFSIKNIDHKPTRLSVISNEINLDDLKEPQRIYIILYFN